MRVPALFAAWCGIAAAVAQEAIPERTELAKAYTERMRPLLQTYCVRCHGPEKQKAGLRLDSLPPEMKADNVATWTEAKNRLDVGEMPPPKESQRPTREELGEMLAWIGGSLTRYDADHRDRGGDTLIRRINHRAYATMLRTLLGVPAQGMENFPADGASDGFDTVGSGLYATSDLYDLYLSGAQQTLDLALPAGAAPPEPNEVAWIGRDWALEEFQDERERVEVELRELGKDPRRYAKWTSNERSTYFKRNKWAASRAVKQAVTAFYGEPSFAQAVAKAQDWMNDAKCIAAVVAALEQEERALRAKEDGVAEFQPLISGGNGPHDPFGRDIGLQVTDPGWYRIRTRLCLSDAARPLPVGIGVDSGFAKQFMLYDPPTAPGTYEATVYLGKGPHRIAVQPFHEFIRFIDYVNATYGTQYQRDTYHDSFFNHEGALLPTNILCAELSVRGPIAEAWPPPSQARVFTRGLDSPPTRDYAEEIVSSFMWRACGGGCDAAMVAPIVDLVMEDYGTGKDFAAAVKYGLAAVLSSPAFLYLGEEQRGAGAARRPLKPFELARRLAYFLWSDLPDSDLLASVASGALSEPDELLAQTRRMLEDPRSRAFREAFVTQWLKTDKLESVAIATDLFPTFDPVLLQSVKEEGVAFFSELLDRNLSVGAFIDCDFAMLDGRLATHYGVAGVSGNGFRRVQLPSGSHRGGVLGMAGVLIATSNGMVSSPVRRGAFVMQRLLGVSPGVPPPNVPALDQVPAANADGTPLSPRERLGLHRANVSCARCHDRIDPLGVGLECFDAVGTWNAKQALLLPERAKDGRPRWLERELDLRGALLDGTPYDGPDELRKLLLGSQDQFLRSLAENLVIYALGRGLELSDRPALDELCKRAASDHGGLATLVEGVVMSELFRNK